MKINRVTSYKRQPIPNEVRQDCYQRDQGRCQEAGCELSYSNGGRMNLHHIQPVQFGGANLADNLVTVCDIHHKQRHIEFSAYYPDSSSVIRRMAIYLNRTLSKLKAMVGLDDGSDLRPYLKFLTGQTEFRPGQLAAIRAALDNRDVLLVAPTGIGKSICYQLPGLIAKKPSLVISPLKALMKDQVEGLWKNKILSSYINSDLGAAETASRYQFIDQDKYQFVFVAPERFQSKDPNTSLLYRDYSYLVVDEAHCIETWGPAFRQAYRHLGKLRQQLNRPPVIALTATASKTSQQGILKSLGIKDAKVIVTGIYRSNIEIKIEANINQARKYIYIRKLVEEHPKDKVLIFVSTVKDGQALLDNLEKFSVQTDFFHSRLDHKHKMRLQNLYSGIEQPELKVLISTSAFGMGIDIPNIRHIIHLSASHSLTDYVQQIGRAGRDGRQSTAHLLHHKSDTTTLRYMAELQVNKPAFKHQHGYSDKDIARVKRNLDSAIDDMLKLMGQPQGKEWQYIIDYFGETGFSYWQRHGSSIFNIALGLLILCLLMLVLSLTS